MPAPTLRRPEHRPARTYREAPRLLAPWLQLFMEEAWCRRVCPDVTLLPCYTTAAFNSDIDTETQQKKVNSLEYVWTD